MQPLAADYNGDGITDMAYWEPGSVTALPYDFRAGGPTAAPVFLELGIRAGCVIPAAPTDYDGDTRTDFVQYLCQEGVWQFADGSDIPWGTPRVAGSDSWWADQPVPLDRDGDGYSELGLFRPETGTWRFKNLRTGGTESVQWGQAFSRQIPVGIDLVRYIVHVPR